MEAIEECNLVFTYGTLKKGCGNANWLLEGKAEYIDQDVTCESYFMGQRGFPYVFKQEVVEPLYEGVEYLPVYGSVWQVDDPKVMDNLDLLEGYPSHYTREVVELKSGAKAWMYLQPDAYYLQYVYISPINKEGYYEW